jgi:hypothetical protein
MKRTTTNSMTMQAKNRSGHFDTKKAPQKPSNIFSLLNSDSDDDNFVSPSTKVDITTESVEKTCETEEETAKDCDQPDEEVKRDEEPVHTEDTSISRKPPYRRSSIHDSINRVEDDKAGDHSHRRFKKVMRMEDEDGWTSNKPKDITREKRFSKSREIYTEDMGIEKDMGNDKKLNSYWTVWIHRNNCAEWTLASYQKIYVINSIGSFWRFFCNFQSFNTFDNHIFIMREEIAPIWEDVNNKFGGICSIKVDSTQNGFKTDISTEMMILITMLIVNETFTANGKNINGIEFSIKKRSALIKIWTKTFVEDDKFIKSLPISLFNCFDMELEKIKKGWFKDAKLSYQYKQIKPEYEV